MLRCWGNTRGPRIPPKRIRKNPEKGRGLGHVTLINFGIPSNISQTSKAIDLKFGKRMHMDNFSKMDK